MAHRQPNLQALAIRLRWLHRYIVVALAIQVGPLLPPVQRFPYALNLAYAMSLACSAAALVLVILVMSAEDNNIVVIILCAIIALAPCINLLLLLLVSSSAQATLKRAGFKVSFFGNVDVDEVVRALNPNLCSSCGYTLTGNTTGVCPECGHRVPRFCRYCGSSVLGTETGDCPSCGQPVVQQGVGP